MRSESDAPGEESGGPAPFGRDGSGGSIGDDGCGGRTDKGVDGVPDGVEPGYFVGEKFEEIEADGYALHDGVGDDGEGVRKMNDAETLKKTERGDSGVKIEAGRKAGAESEAESFEGIHGRRCHWTRETSIGNSIR